MKIDTSVVARSIVTSPHGQAVSTGLQAEVIGPEVRSPGVIVSISDEAKRAARRAKQGLKVEPIEESSPSDTYHPYTKH